MWTVCRSKPRPWSEAFDVAADNLSVIRLQVIDGNRVHDLRLALPANEAGDVLTVGHLARELAYRKSVDVCNQILSFNGQLLTDHRRPLSTIGITNGSIIRLMPCKESRFDPTLYEEQLVNIEKLMDRTRKQFSDLVRRTDAIHRGYALDNCNLTLLTELLYAVVECRESFQKQLGLLSGMSLGDKGQILNNDRSRLVRALMTYVHHSDGLEAGLRDIVTRRAANY